MNGTDEDRVAAAALTQVLEAGRVWTARAWGRTGPAALLSGLRAGHVPEGAQREGDAADALVARARAADGQELLDRAAAAGARLLLERDDGWPRWPAAARAAPEPSAGAATGGASAPPAGRREPSARLLPLAPPVALWVRGADPGPLLATSVAVVGARAATEYGLRVAGEMGHDLAEVGVTVVSGGAYGVDGAAHRGALAAGGTTVAVLAGGVDVPYPRGNAALLERVVGAGGALVSEAAPGAASWRGRFLSRNRLIAAWPEVTVLVEAASRSGALHTAGVARRAGRTVAVVPGPVTSALSAGCHRFLRGAVDDDAPGGRVLVRGPADVLELAGPLDLSVLGGGPDDASGALSPAACRVRDALPSTGAAAASALAREASLSVPDAQEALDELEAAGLARLSDAGWCLVRSGRGRPPLSP